MVRFTLRQLEYFVTIAESETLAAAADRLLISQSTLSQSLSELEKAVGSQLCIRRRSHGVSLTPTGHEILIRARELLRQAVDMQWNVGDTNELRGPLAIGCYVSLAPLAIPRLLESFEAIHTGIEVEFSERTQDELQQELREGAIDLALMFDMELDSTLRSRELARMRPHIIVSENHWLAGARSVWLNDLVEEPMVLLDSPPSAQNTLATYRSLGLSPKIAYEARSYETVRSLVGRGFGYAFVVQRPAELRTYDGSVIRRVEIEDDIPDARLLLTASKQARINDRARAFIEHCENYFETALHHP